jgi:hypothetical protein
LVELCYHVVVAPSGATIVFWRAKASPKGKLHKRTHQRFLEGRMEFETLRFAQGDRSGTPRGRLHKRTHQVVDFKGFLFFSPGDDPPQTRYQVGRSRDSIHENAKTNPLELSSMPRNLRNEAK